MTTFGPLGSPDTNLFAATNGRLPVPVNRFARKQGRTKDTILKDKQMFLHFSALRLYQPTNLAYVYIFTLIFFWLHHLEWTKVTTSYQDQLAISSIMAQESFSKQYSGHNNLPTYSRKALVKCTQGSYCANCTIHLGIILPGLSILLCNLLMRQPKLGKVPINIYLLLLKSFMAYFYWIWDLPTRQSKVKRIAKVRCKKIAINYRQVF